MGELTLQQQLTIEGTAAQLYEQDAEYRGFVAQPWAMVDEPVRRRWRDIAGRKLRTGEIDGWHRVDAVAARRKDISCGRIVEQV